ncbi:MAG: hypothetical protein JXA17_03900 [Dehalococcoidales bacterium]|nr:hypothetical protein [Dehalococcoidales bacterium]
MSPETLDKYIVSNDPDTGKPVIEGIIDTLTKPVKTVKPASEPPKPEKVAAPQLFLEPDTEDNLQELFYEKGWTDGSPIILPTEERVKKMLAGTSASPDDVVAESFKFGSMEMLKYTVSNIAVIAVMAGAKPEYFPVILAIASTRQPALMGSTTAFGTMVLVNGPIRNEIGMNSGIGAFSPINKANSVIGRAWTLMSLCQGQAKPDKTFWSSQGNNYTYNNMCTAENEERSVWEPFHVTKGYKADDSMVSIFRGWAMLSTSGAASHRSVIEELNIQLAVMPPLNSSATIVMDPLVARNLKENEGFSTKQDFVKMLSKKIRIPAGQYWKTDQIDMLVASEAYKGVEPYASWKKLPDDALIAPFNIPENINIVVVGGETSPLFQASNYSYSGSASIDKWRAKK